jgi:hypothetical protein
MSGEYPDARRFDRFRHVKRPSETLTVVAGRAFPDGFAPHEWGRHGTASESDLSPFELTEITAHGYAYKRSSRVSVAARGRPAPTKNK